MEILIYGEYFLPKVGGVQTLIALLAEGLANHRKPAGGRGPQRVNVTLVTSTPAGQMDDSALPYRVVREPSFWRLVQLIRHADVVHLAGPCFLPLVLARLVRKPVVVEHHGYQAACLNGLFLIEPSHAVCPGHLQQGHYRECLRCGSHTMSRMAALRALVLSFPRRWLCERVAANVTVSNHVASRLKLPKSQTIYHGIKITGASAPSGRNSRGSMPEMAYIGRLVTEKGLPVLLQAAKVLHDKGGDFHLTFVGDGPERGRLEELTRESGLNDCVEFTGDLRGAELDAVATKMDVVIMPSVWEETAGLSAIEQMMRGRTVVASDIGGLSEVVADAGWKFPPGNAEALCDRLVNILEHPASAATMGRRAREYALEHFAVDRMIEEHLVLYLQVSGWNSRSPG